VLVCAGVSSSKGGLPGCALHDGSCDHCGGDADSCCRDGAPKAAAMLLEGNAGVSDHTGCCDIGMKCRLSDCVLKCEKLLSPVPKTEA
jgi:hypothetical protein